MENEEQRFLAPFFPELNGHRENLRKAIQPHKLMDNELLRAFLTRMECTQGEVEGQQYHHINSSTINYHSF